MARLVAGAGPGSLRPGPIARTSLVVARLGSPQAKAPPEGYLQIKGMATGGGIGSTMGLSRAIDGYTAPALDIRTRSEERGGRTVWYASIERTSTADSTHESYYPGPGLHRRFASGGTVSIGGQEYTHYVRVSPQMSRLIQRGEQEHLNDFQRAYVLSYRRVMQVVNGLARRRFGPAGSEEQAVGMARRAASRSLGRLGANGRAWQELLYALLRQSGTRDRSHWHDLSFGPERQDDAQKMLVADAGPERSTRIGVPSTRVIQIPRRR